MQASNLVVSIAFAIGTSAHGASYPVKPIRLVIAQTPQSTTAIVARTIAPPLAKALGQPVEIDVRTGAGGLIGTELAANAPADGHHLFMANNSTHGANPAIYAGLSFDAARDFAPVVLIGAMPYLLAAHPSLPARTPRELIGLAKSRPAKLSYASASDGSTQHLAMELLKLMAGIDVRHVPFAGQIPAVTAVLQGDPPLMFATIGAIHAHVQDQRVRALALSTRSRVWFAPDVPTLSEAVPGYEMQSWFGIVAPAATPPELIRRLNAETNKVLDTAHVRLGLVQHGIDPRGGSPARFGEHIRTEIAKLKKIVKAVNLKVNVYGDS